MALGTQFIPTPTDTGDENIRNQEEWGKSSYFLCLALSLPKKAAQLQKKQIVFILQTTAF